MTLISKHYLLSFPIGSLLWFFSPLVMLVLQLYFVVLKRFYSSLSCWWGLVQNYILIQTALFFLHLFLLSFFNQLTYNWEHHDVGIPWWFYFYWEHKLIWSPDFMIMIWKYSDKLIRQSNYELEKWFCIFKSY